MAVFFKEGFAPVVGDQAISLKGLMEQLATDILESSNEKWTLHFPAAAASITNLFVLKHVLGTAPDPTREVYLEFYRPLKVETPDATKAALVQGEKNNYFYMECVYGHSSYTQPNESDEAGNFTAPGTWAEDVASVRSRFSWFNSATTSNIKKWLPVQYWISVTDRRIAIVLAGDASANKLDRLISFGYFGELKPFKNSTERPIANFGISVGSDKTPGDYLLNEEMNRYSDKTGTGVTDINMLQTYTGFPMQAHYPAFTTPDELVDKKLEGPSQYTQKYHMSPVYVFHGFDGYRGQLDGIIATDRSTVVNLDDLIHKYNSTTGSEDDPDTQDIYKTFLVSSPYSLLNNSTNVLYGIAMLKETEAIVEES